MKKKIICILLFIPIIIMSLPVTANADMGPKPFIQVRFENVGDEECYGTILSSASSLIMYSSATPGSTNPYDKDSIDYTLWDAFVNYEDPDGYYFLQTFSLCSESEPLEISYDLPSTFKVLLYYPETGVFLTSDICEKYNYEFNYYYVDMSGISSDSEGIILQVNVLEENYTLEIIFFFCRIFITIILEILIALLFSFKQKRQIIIIVIVNIITQLFLNYQLVGNWEEGWGVWFMFFYFIMEIAVFLIEAIIYSVLFKLLIKEKEPIWKSILYALIANAFSFVVGIILTLVLPITVR